MSTEPIKESPLERKVRERKEAALLQGDKTSGFSRTPEIEQAKPLLEPAPNTLPKAEAILEPSTVGVQKMIAWVIQAIEQNTNPMLIARKLAEIQATGLSSKDLAHALRMSKAWVSKRLGLLKAPEEVQQQIESGVLSEHEFYSHRAQIESRASKTKRQTLQYARMPTVTISIDAAHVLAGILKKLTVAHGLNPIVLNEKTGKKELVSILNLRPHDIFRALK